MTVKIPHSLDAVIEAVEALIAGRPMPEEWSKEPEPDPVPVAPVQEPEQVADSDPVPADPPPQPASASQVIDEVLLAQAISDLVDRKFASMPPPVAPAPAVNLDPLSQRLATLETAFAALPPGFPEAVLVCLDSQSSQTIRGVDLEQRVSALESVIWKISSAIHKEDAA